MAKVLMTMINNLNTTQWFAIGDHEAVTQLIVPRLALDLCPDCRKSYSLHGILNGTKVCPGNYVIDKTDGSYICLTAKNFANQFTSVVH